MTTPSETNDSPQVKCPIFPNEHVNPLFEIVDYAVTKETFRIYETRDLGFRFTFPIPSVEDSFKYYDDESYISHSKTSATLKDKLFHIARLYTLGMKKRVINFNFKGEKKRLLDLGCGSGDFAAKMKHSGWEVVGVEPAEKARIFASGEHGLDVFQSLDNLPNNTTFSVITAWHVLEHIHDIEDSLAKIHHLLDDDGILVVALPNFTSFDAGFYKQVWAGYDVPRHLYHFSANSITRLAQQHGFELKQMRRMWLDAFYVSLLSESYMNTGFAGYLGAFIIGLWSNISAIFKKEKCSSIIYVFSKR